MLLKFRPPLYLAKYMYWWKELQNFFHNDFICFFIFTQLLSLSSIFNCIKFNSINEFQIFWICNCLGLCFRYSNILDPNFQLYHLRSLLKVYWFIRFYRTKGFMKTEFESYSSMKRQNVQNQQNNKFQQKNENFNIFHSDSINKFVKQQHKFNINTEAKETIKTLDTLQLNKTKENQKQISKFFTKNPTLNLFIDTSQCHQSVDQITTIFRSTKQKERIDISPLQEVEKQPKLGLNI